MGTDDNERKISWEIKHLWIRNIYCLNLKILFTKSETHHRNITQNLRTENVERQKVNIKETYTDEFTWILFKAMSNFTTLQSLYIGPESKLLQMTNDS